MSGESCNCGPGQSANFASSVVRRAAEDAKRADRLALLSAMRGEICCKSSYKTNLQNASQSSSGSILASELSKRTIDAGPKAPVGGTRMLSSGVYTDNLRRMTIEAETDQFNPETRFSRYGRYEPPAPCPTYTRNPAVPVAPAGNCYPSRFYGSGKYY